jgi:hypothetical protein
MVSLERCPQTPGPGPVTARRQSPSDADEAIHLLDETGDVRRGHPLGAQRRKVFVSRPPGDRASFSDVHGHVVLPSLGEQVAHGRHADTFESFADVELQQLRRVAGEHHADGVTNFQRAVDGEVEWD